jgi:hypothetical protein
VITRCGNCKEFYQEWFTIKIETKNDLGIIHKSFLCWNCFGRKKGIDIKVEGDNHLIHQLDWDKFNGLGIGWRMLYE